ncbi:MAG: molybdopterin-dependent oxidoreductase [Ornithinimicrobium sp.]
MRPPIPTPEMFTSRLRSPYVAARVGVWLGIAFGICFVTGLISHYAQAVNQPIPFPTNPAWGYRLNQGLHVASGTAAIPLVIVKLWAVYPRLFEGFPIGQDARKMLVAGLERASIAVLVAAAIFELVTGLLNSTQWYPWSFSFRSTHFALAWITIGALLVHIAVKLPIIRDVLLGDIDEVEHDRPAAVEEGALSRRGLVRTTFMAAGVAVLATAGATVPWLRQVSVLGSRTGDGPQGIPINKSAQAARVTDDMVGADYRLTVVAGGVEMSFSREELLGMPQRTETLPIACVEGWSASAQWSGVRVRDLMDMVDAPSGSDVVVRSLQPSGPFRNTTLQANFAADDRTLVALKLNGEDLNMDHGYPCRLIAPNRPGVLQTKWVGALEVQT